MKHDTPLEEVALHLPAATAAALGDTNFVIQEVVLTHVRDFVVDLERRGISLDSIAYDAVLGGLCEALVFQAQESMGCYVRLQRILGLAREIEDLSGVRA